MIRVANIPANRIALSLVAASVLSLNLAGRAGAQSDTAAAVCLPDTTLSVGVPQTFATHSERARLGFLWGPSDGNFGAIPTGGGNYMFYGTGGSKTRTPSEGAYTFTGTLGNVLGANTATKLFGPGSGPAGWCSTATMRAAAWWCASTTATAIPAG